MNVVSSAKKAPHRDVVNVVVASDLCIGCGVCAAVCPSRLLTMDWSAQGELVPDIMGECPPKCDLCLVVCPFTGEGPDQDKLSALRFGALPDIHRRDDLGYFLECYAGHAADAADRGRGASGGVLRTLLRSLLDQGFVDRVVCVTTGPGTSSSDLFQFDIVEQSAAINDLPSSAYYPAELSQALRTIFTDKEDRRYAVVGLPCVLHGVNLAMAKLPRLRQRIAFTIALVCGQLPNRSYTEYLATAAGAPWKEVKAVSYRSKVDSTMASNFAFVAQRRDGGPTHPVWLHGGASRLWTGGYFKHNACNCCDDVFGEVADAAVMDAWLPRFVNDPRGHSLVVVRSPALREVLHNMAHDGLCVLEPIAADEVARSQANVLHKKKWLIQGYLFAAQRAGRWMPSRRLSPSREIWLRGWWTLFLARWVMVASKRHWPKIRDTGSASVLHRAMWPVEVLLWVRSFLQHVQDKLKRLCRRCSDKRIRTTVTTKKPTP